MKRITGKTKDATLLEMTNKADAHVEGMETWLEETKVHLIKTFMFTGLLQERLVVLVNNGSLALVLYRICI